MMELVLKTGEIILVDDADYEIVSRYRWSRELRKIGNTYAYSHILKIKMHRFILNEPPNFQVDHINGNGLDNRRKNLRLCTHGQNSMNRRMYACNKSGYKGVQLPRDGKTKFRAVIRVNRKPIYIGSYETKEQAALAYNIAALKYHGEFACLNQL